MSAEYYFCLNQPPQLTSTKFLNTKDALLYLILWPARVANSRNCLMKSFSGVESHWPNRMTRPVPRRHRTRLTESHVTSSGAVLPGSFTAWCRWHSRWPSWGTWRSWQDGCASPSFTSSAASLATWRRPSSCRTEPRWEMHASAFWFTLWRQRSF